MYLQSTLKASILATFSRMLLQNNSLKKANVTKLTENISTLRTCCACWLQFQLLINLMSESVHYERSRSLPLSLLATGRCGSRINYS